MTTPPTIENTIISIISITVATSSDVMPFSWTTFWDVRLVMTPGARLSLSYQQIYLWNSALIRSSLTSYVRFSAIVVKMAFWLPVTNQASTIQQDHIIRMILL